MAKIKKKTRKKAKKKEIPEEAQSDMERRDYALSELVVKPDDQFYQDKDLTIDDIQKGKVVRELATMISAAETGPYNTKKQQDFKRADWLWKAKINPRTFPFAGAASVGVPLVKTKGRKIERSLDGEVNRNRPAVPMAPQEKNDVEKTAKAEQYIEWKAKQMRVDIPRAFSIRDAYKYGTGLIKTTHVVEKERVTEAEVWDGRPENPNQQRDIFLFAEKYPEEEDYAVMLLKGQKLTLDVSYNKTLYRGPRMERVARPNFIFPEGYTDIEKMPWYFEKMTFSWAELQDGVREGRFEEDTLKKIRSFYSPKKKGGSKKTRSIKDKPGSETDYLHKKYTVYEGMWKYAKRQGGVRERCMFTIIPAEKIYLRGIKYPFNHSHPYITPFYLIRDADAFDGECVAMDLEDMQVLHNMIVNNSLDSDMFNMPTFWQDRDSTGEEFDPSGWYPGKVWSAGKDEIGQMAGSASSANALGLLSVVARFGDDVSGVSELMSGRETSRDPNAPGNKSQLLLGESKQDMGAYFRTWTKSYNECWWQACELMDQYGTDGEEFRVLNQGGKPAFDSAPDSLGVRPDMEPRTSEPQFSQDGRKMLTADLMEKLQADPVLMPFFQQKPDLWMELWERYADSAGPGLTKIMYELGEYIKQSTGTQEGLMGQAALGGMGAGERVAARGALPGLSDAGMGLNEAGGGM